MVRTELHFEYLQRPLIKPSGLIILALFMEREGEVVVTRRNVGMVLATTFFADLYGSSVERLSLLMLALDPKQFGEVIVTDENARIILAESPFTNLDRPSIERLGLV